MTTDWQPRRQRLLSNGEWVVAHHCEQCFAWFHAYHRSKQLAFDMLDRKLKSHYRRIHKCRSRTG